MIIRVDTLENLICDVSKILGKDSLILLSDLQNFKFSNCDDFVTEQEKVYEYIRENRAEELTAFYLCHLCRQASDYLPNVLLPLDQLLTSSNAFSTFLRQYGIEFEKESGVLYGKRFGKSVDAPSQRIRLYDRLSKDFAVNGFRFLYDIKNTTKGNYQNYTSKPEFLADIDAQFGLHMCEEYHKLTMPYCALCRLAPEQLLLSNNKSISEFVEDYLYNAMRYIRDSCYSSMHHGDNPYIFALDTEPVYVERWVPESELL